MTKRSKVVVVTFALAAVAAMTLQACQTVKGAGKDIQYVGEKTEQAIQGK